MPPEQPAGAPRRVAFVWQSPSMTGAQRRFFGIAAALNARGQPAIVLLDERNARALERSEGGPVPHLVRYRLPWWVDLWRRGRGRVPRLHRALRLDRAYRMAARAFWRGLLRQHRVGLAHVSMSGDLAHCVGSTALFEVTSPDWAERLGAEPGTVPAGMLLHAVSDSVFHRLRAHLPDRRIRCAPMLFPNLDPAAAPPPDRTTRENLVVFAHRLIPRKHGVTFARAAKRFLARRPDWRVSIRGEGPDAPEIARILAGEIAAGRVMTGYVADLPAELRRSRIFVSIIEADNYPSQSVVEAMVCGNALLLSDRGATRAAFFDGNGRMTQPDEDRVLDDLTALAGDPAALDAMGLQSRHLAARRFSQQAYLEHLAELYAEIGFRVSWRGPERGPELERARESAPRAGEGTPASP